MNLTIIVLSTVALPAISALNAENKEIRRVNLYPPPIRRNAGFSLSRRVKRDKNRNHNQNRDGNRNWKWRWNWKPE